MGASPDFTENLDWTFSYVDPKEAFPASVCGATPTSEDARTFSAACERATPTPTPTPTPLAARSEPPRTANDGDLSRLDRGWVSALQLHSAFLALPHFADALGQLRCARFAPVSAWRSGATHAALESTSRAQTALSLMHDLVKQDARFDWTHRFFHTNHWLAIAARRFVDEWLLVSSPMELAVASYVISRCGFADAHLDTLHALACGVEMPTLETMVRSMREEHAQRSQLGESVLGALVEHDPTVAQSLVDKWFWRAWLPFSFVNGITRDYLIPLGARTRSFESVVREDIAPGLQSMVGELGLNEPWYWPIFLDSAKTYHHMSYASVYTYRGTMWFDMPIPAPDERAWLAANCSSHWSDFEAVWTQVDARWSASGPGLELYSHAMTPPSFCRLCNFMLCHGSTKRNDARSLTVEGRTYMVRSAPCEHLLREEPNRYTHHEDVIARILRGEASGNLLELTRKYFDLAPSEGGRDAASGRYPWITRTMIGKGTDA